MGGLTAHDPAARMAALDGPLQSPYFGAAAAAGAGVPQQGLGGMSSEDLVRVALPGAAGLLAQGGARGVAKARFATAFQLQL